MQKIIADEAAVSAMFDRLARQLVATHADLDRLCLVGIKTRGAHMAKRLQKRIAALTNKTTALAELDITLYRDDLTQVAQNPQLKSTALDENIDGKNVVLVDDVLYSGRTVLCALTALAAFGRAAKTELLVLVDRGHHTLPITADYVALVQSTAAEDIIHVHLTEKDGDDKIVHNIGGQRHG